ncbi:MAG: 50S ribosomal protein L4 [Phycisphaerae bacterium]|nr:50S ribosomal protein L4 [Phycisphaerae bacterium]
MLSIPVYDESGKQVGSEQIDPAALGGEVNVPLLKQAVVMYHANRRQGTVAQKSRGMVEGSTKKIYRQKGTGNARQGPARAPHRRGGGRAFARAPRDFSKDMPRQMRRLARDNAVLAKINGNAVRIVDRLAFEGPKTKRFSAMLKALDSTRGCTFATRGIDAVLYRSGRNIPRTNIVDVAQLNAYDILSRPRLIFTRDAFVTYRDGLGGAKDKA